VAIGRTALGASLPSGGSCESSREQEYFVCDGGKHSVMPDGIGSMCGWVFVTQYTEEELFRPGFARGS
jgi:hypothetical protein